MKPILVNIRDVAKLLSVDINTARWAAEDGEIPRPLFFNGKARWRHEDLMRWATNDCPEASPMDNGEWEAFASALRAELKGLSKNE